MATLTGIIDCDLWVVRFLPIKDVRTFRVVCKGFAERIDSTPLGKEMAVLSSCGNKINPFTKAHQMGLIQLMAKYFYHENRLDVESAINTACKTSRTDILDWLVTTGLFTDTMYGDWQIDYAVKYANINILEWFHANGYPMKYSEYTINLAAELAHCDVLDWFANNNYEIIYTANAIDMASADGHVCILDWFNDRNYEIKYTAYAINHAASNGHLNVLNWFKDHNYVIKYTDYALISAFRFDHQGVIKWFETIDKKLVDKFSGTERYDDMWIK